jgi:transposase, IS6 family
LRWYYQPRLAESWKVDETYVKVKGVWKYLYRAITKSGKALDFYLSSTRNAKAAKRLLGKILRRMKEYEKPKTINTDQAPSYGQAIRELKEEGLLNDHVLHLQVKYLNNLIEADHGKLKRLIKPTLGFNQ